MFPESNKEDDRLSKENLRLKSAAEELSILNDLATAIASTQSLDQITKLIVKMYRTIRIMPITNSRCPLS